MACVQTGVRTPFDRPLVLNAGGTLLAGGVSGFSAALGLGVLQPVLGVLAAVNPTVWLVAAVLFAGVTAALLVLTLEQIMRRRQFLEESTSSGSVRRSQEPTWFGSSSNSRAGGGSLVRRSGSLHWRRVLPQNAAHALLVNREELKNNPELYYFRLASFINPRATLHRVSIVEADGSAYAVDAGGPWREFIASLFSLLFDDSREGGDLQALSFDGQGIEGTVFPNASSETEQMQYYHMGRILGVLSRDSQLAVTGPVFSDEVFDVLFVLLNSPSLRQRVREGEITSWKDVDRTTLLRAFVQIDPQSKLPLLQYLADQQETLVQTESDKQWMQYFLDPDGEIEIDEIPDLTGVLEDAWFVRLQDACFARLQDFYEEQGGRIEALLKIAEGILSVRPSGIPADNARELQAKIAGSVEVGDLLNRLEVSVREQENHPTYRWLRSWIQGSRLEQRMQFLKAVTGSSALPLSNEARIRVNFSAYQARNSFPTFGTCARRINFPVAPYEASCDLLSDRGMQGEMNQGVFIDRLQVALCNAQGFDKG